MGDGWMGFNICADERSGAFLLDYRLLVRDS